MLFKFLVSIPIYAVAISGEFKAYISSVLFSSMIIISAEGTEANTESSDESSITIIDENGTKAYELVWRYKSNGTHLWRRRWNMTLGGWYDPEWILVY